MRIQAVQTNFTPVNIQIYRSNCTGNISTSKDSYHPSFGNYARVLTEAANGSYKTERQVGEAFDKIYKALKKEGRFSIMPGTGVDFSREFSYIDEIYNKSGYRGVRRELWKAFPDYKISNLMRKANDDPVTLAKRKSDGKPLITLINYGKHGFWNSIFNNKSATNNYELHFEHPDINKFISFGLDKDGGLKISQCKSTEIVHTRYHASTGYKKSETRQGYGQPDTTYFNKDGSVDETKTFFVGGNPPIVY